MSQRSQVFLKDRRTGLFVEASLVDGILEAEVTVTNEHWTHAFGEAKKRLQGEGVNPRDWPQHAHWDWKKKWAAVEGKLMYRMLGVEADGEMQGLMLVSAAGYQCRIPSQRGKPLIYVDYIATAPWNSPVVVPEPRYALVGRILLAAAVEISRAEEFSGRIGLHSLPQAESWYRDRCCMTDLGPDRNERSRLRYFEMTPAQADEFLK